jgi:uridine phosphorylase
LNSFAAKDDKMIQDSELILNSDGTIFHLHLKPENIADQIILVGDQDRVNTVASFFDTIIFEAENREFKTATGWYKKRKITVISTGIGTDNIDIVLNELDALANIDLEKRVIKKEKKSLQFVRIGTSGGLQENISLNAYVVSQKSIGFDGMLNFYANREAHCDLKFEEAFKKFTGWKKSLPELYVVDASQNLLQKFNTPDFINGVTISAPGFYGPQGRVLRLPLSMPELNSKIEDFQFQDFKISNFEMESSAIYGLSKMMGHEALAVCLIIANRILGQANENYRPEMEKLIQIVLDHLIQ